MGNEILLAIIVLGVIYLHKSLTSNTLPLPHPPRRVDGFAGTQLSQKLNLTFLEIKLPAFLKNDLLVTGVFGSGFVLHYNIMPPLRRAWWRVVEKFNFGF